MLSKHLPLLGLALVAFAVGGCGGKMEESDLVISDGQGALEGTDPSGNTSAGDIADDEDDDKGDERCRDDGDHDGHKHHRKHWFRVLDAMDGAKDRVITIASLPPGLPDRLMKRLQKIDRNGDGLVTKDEVKAARRHRKHRGERHDGEQEQERDSD